MLTEYVSVDVFLGNVEVFRQSARSLAESSTVPGTKDPVSWKSGDLCKHVGQVISTGLL